MESYGKVYTGFNNWPYQENVRTLVMHWHHLLPVVDQDSSSNDPHLSETSTYENLVFADSVVVCSFQYNTYAPDKQNQALAFCANQNGIPDDGGATIPVGKLKKFFKCYNKELVN
jgi:hypothetical protein